MITRLDKPREPIVAIVSVAALALLLGGCMWTMTLGGHKQPSAILQVDLSSGPAPLSVIFDISNSSDPDGTIAGFELQFGDGASIAGEDLTLPVSHTYADDGYYTAVLKITDDDDLTDHAKLHIAVSNPGPTVGFVCTPQVAQPGDTVACTACGQTTDPADLKAEPNSVITYEWDFGDGHQVSSQSCTTLHTYGELGSFDVSLRIYDDDGAMATTTVADCVTIRGRLYWTEFRVIPSYGTETVSRIHRSGLNGADREELVSGYDSMKWGIALDLTAGKMYWTDEEAGTIQRADLDGASVETLVSGLGGPMRIALDRVAGKMYWTDWTDDTILRADLDGTSIELLVAGLSDPFGIAVDSAAGRCIGRIGRTARSNALILMAQTPKCSSADLVSQLESPWTLPQGRCTGRAEAYPPPAFNAPILTARASTISST